MPLLPRPLITASLLSSLLLLCPGAAGGRAGLGVTVLPCPSRDCLAPDVLLDASGVLHVVWGTSDKQAYYARSADGRGANFSAAVRLNGPENVTTTMGERGPKISGAGGFMAVIWADLWFPGATTFPRFSVSRDAGLSWSAPALAGGAGARKAVDGLTAAIDAGGALLVAFHGAQAGEPVPNASEATWLFVAASPDGGASWSTPAGGARVALPAANGGGAACSMCGMRARALGGGRFALALRTAGGNVRDHQLVFGAAADGFATATAARVPVGAPWLVQSCPMNGPELALLGAGPAAVLAFMSSDANRVYWAAWSGSAFSAPVPTPRGDDDARYPTAVANAAGDVLLVWQVGPMAVEGTAQVKYALYDYNGTSLGPAATVGTTFAGTKATAWVARDDSFFVMTSALEA